MLKTTGYGIYLITILILITKRYFLISSCIYLEDQHFQSRHFYFIYLFLGEVYFAQSNSYYYAPVEGC